MKATHKTFAGMVERALGRVRVFYFCGADEAGAGDAAARVIARIDAAQMIEFTGADLKRDPTRLTDEARSTSLFGDTTVIRIAMAGDDAHDAIANLLDDPVAGWPVIAVASGATDKSRVAKLLELRDDALVTVFHPPDLNAVIEMVRNAGEAAGLRLSLPLAQRLAQAAALDTRIARSEIEKLALYCDASPQSPKTPSPDDMTAIGTVTSDDSMAPLVNATLGGMTERLHHELPRLTCGDFNPVGLLLALERRAVQLAQLTARMGSNGNVNKFMDQEAQARRVFFKDKADLTLQLHKWRGVRLERLLTRLAALHKSMLTDSNNAALRLQQSIVEIARAACR